MAIVYKRIQERAESGKYDLSNPLQSLSYPLDYNIEKMLYKELENQGYTVKHYEGSQCQHEPSYYTVSWK